MRQIICILIGSVLLIAGCKGKNDVLATYEGGNITRGEFYTWIESRHISLENILKKKNQQNMKIRQLVLNKLAVQEAKKAGYDKNEEYKRLETLVKRNFTAGFLRKKVRGDTEFKEKAVRLSVVKLLVKNFKMVERKRVKLTEAQLKKEFEKKKKEALDIVKKLEEGKKFADMAKKYSDDYSKKKGGDIGYVIDGMREPEVIEAALKLEKGEFTKEPVEVKNGIYIIKVDDKVTLTPDNIEDVIESEPAAKRMMKRIQINSAKNFEKDLKKAGEVKDNLEKANFNSPSAVLFEIAGEKFTVKDLNEMISFIYERRASGKKIKFDENRKRQIARRVFREKLLMREAKKRNIFEDEAYKEGWNTFREFTLAGSYRNDMVLKDISVSSDDIKAEYYKNKDRIYSKRIKKGKKTVKQVKPLSEVRDTIERRLMNRKRAMKIRTWQNSLLKKHNFKIVESELEGK